MEMDKNNDFSEKKSPNEKIAELKLGSISLTVKTLATPSELKQTRDLVRKKFDEFQDRYKDSSLSEHEISVLTSFHIAEELLHTQEKLKKLQWNLMQKTEVLIDKVDSQLKEI